MHKEIKYTHTHTNLIIYKSFLSLFSLYIFSYNDSNQSFGEQRSEYQSCRCGGLYC